MILERYPVGVWKEANRMTQEERPEAGCTACLRHKRTPRDPEELKRLKNRLNRMAGQLGGIGKMLDENRYCGDILIQVAAIEKALQSFGYTILKEHMETCMVEDIAAGHGESIDEVIDLVRKLK